MRKWKEYAADNKMGENNALIKKYAEKIDEHFVKQALSRTGTKLKVKVLEQNMYSFPPLLEWEDFLELPKVLDRIRQEVRGAIGGDCD